MTRLPVIRTRRSVSTDDRSWERGTADRCAESTPHRGDCWEPAYAPVVVGRGSPPTSTPRRLWPFAVAVVLLLVGAAMLFVSDNGWADRTGWILLAMANVITLVTCIFNISRFVAAEK
jgi:hypothetical protein